MTTAEDQVQPVAGSRLADHTTPFIRNEWYVAAMSDELDQTLRDRLLLGVGILLYRTEDGTAVALPTSSGCRRPAGPCWNRISG